MRDPFTDMLETIFEARLQELIEGMIVVAETALIRIWRADYQSDREEHLEPFVDFGGEA